MAGCALNQLPIATVNLIGSGQVIVSVYSVIKELVENSVDSGATSLDIKIENYGLDKVEVCDNGSGIKVSDVPYVAKRHYTSKLTSTEDLMSLTTYGFRGEALASLCAVSDVTITTKTKDDDISYTYSIDHEGNISDKKPCHLGKGTTVTAYRLFHNLPVRKQYYATSQHKREDVKKIEDLLIAFGIIKPQLRITFRHNKDLLLQKLPLNQTKAVISAVFGREIAGQLLYQEKDIEIDGLSGKISAYVPKPGSDVKIMSRSTGDRTILVVNDRPVQIKELLKVVKHYYNNCHPCETVRYPVCYINLTLPGSNVDVNIDPNKTTVLLHSLKEIQNSLEELLLKVYGPLDNVPPWHYSEKDVSNGASDKDDTQKMAKTDASLDSLDTSIEDTANYMSAASAAEKLFDQDKEFSFQTARETAGSVVEISNNAIPTFSVTFHNQPEQSHQSNFTAQKNVEHCQVDSVNLISDDSWTSTVEKCLETTQCLHLEPDKNVCSTKQTEEKVPEFVNRNSENGKDGTEIQGAKTDSTCELSVMENSLSTSSITSDWSRGSMFVDTLGQPVQPVQLLAPSSKHHPGKHQLLQEDNSLETSAKRKKLSLEHIDANQSTLDAMFSRSEGIPGYKQFCVENSQKILEQGASENPGDEDILLKKEWDKLNEVEKSKYRETEREKAKRLDSAPSAIKPKLSKTSKLSARDQVAVLASQSQENKPKRKLKKKHYCAERRINFAMHNLRAAVERNDAQSERIVSLLPSVIGQTKTCDVWFSCFKNNLHIVNIHRLSEVLLYQKLKQTFRLEANPCTSPIALDSSRFSESTWSTLKLLALSSRTGNTFFSITDERLTANGFSVKCHFDLQNKLSAELVGLSNIIPAYCVSDLIEVLELINRDFKVTLETTRPTKVLYFLQGEAVRMMQQNVSGKTKLDVQEMVEQLPDTTALCLHHRPIFHHLFDLSLLEDDETETL